MIFSLDLTLFRPDGYLELMLVIGLVLYKLCNFRALVLPSASSLMAQPLGMDLI